MNSREDIKVIVAFARSALTQEKERAQEVVNTLTERIKVVEKSLERVEARFRPSEPSEGDNIESLDISPENE